MEKEINIEGFKAENGYCGLRNKITGKELTFPLYSSITLDGKCLCVGDDCEDTLSLMSTNVEDLYVMIDYYLDGCETFCKLLDGKQGEIISNSYNYISTQFVCGLCRVAGYGGYTGDGYIDTAGKQVINLDEKFHPQCNPSHKFSWWYWSSLGAKYSDLESELEDRRFRDFTEDGLAAVCFRQNDDSNIRIWGYIDTLGEIAIAPQYDEAGDFIDGVAKVRFNSESYGFINTEDEEVIPVKYDYAEDFIDGKAEVTLGDETFYIDTQGNRI